MNIYRYVGMEFTLKDFLISVHVDQKNDITWSHLLTMEKEELEKVTFLTLQWN